MAGWSGVAQGKNHLSASREGLLRGRRDVGRGHGSGWIMTVERTHAHHDRVGAAWRDEGSRGLQQ